MALTATVAVRTYELDSFGHVNNSTYLCYLEAARAEYLQQVGLSFNTFAQEGIQLVIVEAQIRYLAPARYGDILRIEGTFHSFRGATITIDYRVIDSATERLLATAMTRGAFFDPQSNRPIRAPEPFRSAFQQAVTLSGGDTPTPL